MTYIRALIIIVAIILIALIASCYSAAGISMAQINALLATPWVLVMVVDSLLGVICFAVLIFHFEEEKQTALLWTVGILIFGNLVTAAWTVLRLLPRLSR